LFTAQIRLQSTFLFSFTLPTAHGLSPLPQISHISVKSHSGIAPGRTHGHPTPRRVRLQPISIVSGYTHPPGDVGGFRGSINLLASHTIQFLADASDRVGTPNRQSGVSLVGRRVQGGPSLRDRTVVSQLHTHAILTFSALSPACVPVRVTRVTNKGTFPIEAKHPAKTPARTARNSGSPAQPPRAAVRHASSIKHAREKQGDRKSAGCSQH
jgi:hypothetical protein